MKRSTWILVVGFIAAGVLLAAGASNTHRLLAQRRLCVPQASDELLTWHPPAEEFEDVAACIKKKLRGELPSLAVISASEKWPRVAAAIVAILGALPWAWYFLLRRIAELRAAIGGKPPAG